MAQSVVYARVSSKEQAEEGFSIPAQTKLLRDYALQHGFEIAQEFVDVETAKRAGRTGFGEMVAYLKRSRGACRVVLVEKTDRLYRNLRDYVTLDELDLEIHFVKENFVLSDDSRSTEKFMHGIKVLMAKNYIDNLSEETSKGMLEKARQGKWPSWAPLGYINLRIGDERVVVPDPEQAPVVRRMFEWYAAGDCSLEEVRHRAIEAGLRGRRGTAPSKSTVADTLQNVFYTGLFKWKGRTYQGDHEPLVSMELFERTQVASKKDNKPLHKPEQTFPYTGLLRCAHCGCAITAERKKGKYVYYHCTGFRGGCDKHSIREERLEELLGEVVRAITIDAATAEWIIEALRESHREEREYHDAQVATLQKEYARLQNRIDQAYEDKLDRKISEETWERKSAEWRAAQMRTRVALEQHENANQCYFDEGSRILELASKAYSLWIRQDSFEKRKLLDILLSNCTFDGENLHPDYKKPFRWWAEGLECSDWLPEPDNCENFVESFTFPLQERSPAGLPNHQGQQITERTPAIEQALGFRRLLDEGIVASQKELAQLHGLTPARVSQVLALLRLPPEIVNYLQSLPAGENNFYSERRLRIIARIPGRAHQIDAFADLQRRAGRGH